MAGRRRFGKVRRLPSGRWQASYLDPEGIRRPAPETFRKRRETEQWLSVVEAELLQGEWLNPDDQRVTLEAFGDRWISERSGLSGRTVDLYRSLMRNHLTPHIGRLALGDLTAARVRKWRADRLAAGVSATMTAKAYRLLRAILMTAVDDGILARNPCRIRGAGAEPAVERPVLTVAQVFDLAKLMPNESFRTLVLVTTFGSLRWGEVTALRGRDVDPKAGAIWVRTAFGRQYSGKVERKEPKSRAGMRLLIVPRPVADLLVVQLAERVRDDPDALVFTGDRGGHLQRSNFNTRVGWSKAVKDIGVPGLHFHDLRHTGNTLAAMTGASLRDLMTRMGHDSMRAALIYQHNTQGADRKIADAMEALISDHESAQDGAEDSEPGAREGHEGREGLDEDPPSEAPNGA